MKIIEKFDALLAGFRSFFALIFMGFGSGLLLFILSFYSINIRFYYYSGCILALLIALIWLMRGACYMLSNYYFLAQEPAIIDKTLHRWHIDDQGNFTTNVLTTIVNRSNSPLPEFGPEKAGFLSEIEFPKITCNTINGPPFVSVGMVPAVYDKTVYGSAGLSSKVFYWTWHWDIIPQLKPKETITFEYSYRVPKSESLAFTREGTYAGIKVLHSTKYLEMLLFAPFGYRIRLLAYYIADEAGVASEYEKRKNPAPGLLFESHAIIWRIPYPKRTLRYFFHYSFVDDEHFWEGNFNADKRALL